MTAPARKGGQMALATRAAILGQDRQFRRFAGQRSGAPGQEIAADAAADFIRRWCKVSSRRDLDTVPAAAAHFNTLLTEFDAWRGRIARPR